MACLPCGLSEKASLPRDLSEKVSVPPDLSEKVSVPSGLSEKVSLPRDLSEKAFLPCGSLLSPTNAETKPMPLLKPDDYSSRPVNSDINPPRFRDSQVVPSSIGPVISASPKASGPRLPGRSDILFWCSVPSRASYNYFAYVFLKIILMGYSHANQHIYCSHLPQKRNHYVVFWGEKMCPSFELYFAVTCW